MTCAPGSSAQCLLIQVDGPHGSLQEACTSVTSSHRKVQGTASCPGLRKALMAATHSLDSTVTVKECRMPSWRFQDEKSP